MLASHIDVHLGLIHACDGVHWDEKVTLADTEEPARSNLEHPDLSLSFVDEEAAYVPDLVFMPIDYLATAEVLMGICEHEAGVRQSNERCIARRSVFCVDVCVVLNLFQVYS
jgi:hypothetical protein